MDGEVITKGPSLEEVNQHLLNKLDRLIQDADDSETIASLTESLAKYNSSIRNNDIFSPQESDKEKTERMTRDLLGEVIKGENV